LHGLTYISLIEGDDTTTAEEIAKHFERKFGASPKEENNEPQVYITETDPQLAEISYDGRIPDDWHVRALFFGNEGARNWLSVEKSPEYLSEDDKRRMRAQSLNVIAKIKDADNVLVPTCISLGPGSAEAERHLVIDLDSKGTIHYIPVDISEGLLRHAARQLHDCARVTFGILCDLEERTNFIQRRLEGRVQHPILFTLLGNTLGNFDKYEYRFMKRIEGLLKKDDYLLLEVTILTPEWKLEADRRYDLFRQPDAMKRFYAQGLAHHTGTSVESIVSAYTQLIEAQQGGSDVPGAVSVEYKQKDKSRIIVSNRRYDWGKFLSWLDKFSFSILGHEELRLAKGNIGIGTVLLKKT
jgi:hypothetical protein